MIAHLLTSLPMAELFPCPELPIVSLLSLAAGFWYGYRHPEEF